MDHKDRALKLEKTRIYSGWKIYNAELTEVALKICIQAAGNSLSSAFPHSLLDLLGLIREIALQGECFMPIVVRLKAKEGFYTDKGVFHNEINKFKRRQDLHHGNFFFLPALQCTTQADPLLHPGGEDIKIKPPEIIDLGTFREGYEKDQTDIENMFNLFPEQLPSGQLSLDSWETFWQDRFAGKRSEGDTTDDARSDSGSKKNTFSPAFGRIKTIDIKNFKGIKKAENIDLDADIILVTGANGNGKSSFVEAINLALTGYHPDMKKEEDDYRAPGHFFHYDADEFTVRLTGKDEENKPTEIKTSCQKNNSRQLQGKQTTIECRYGDDIVSIPSQLNFRLTSYLPDHIDKLFDENIDKKGKEETDILTVKDLFPSLTPPVRALQRVVKKEIEKEEKEKEDQQKAINRLDADARFIQEQSADFFQKLADHLKPIDKAIGKQIITPLEWHTVQNDPVSVAKAIVEQKRNIFDQQRLDNWVSLEAHLQSIDKELPELEKIQKAEREKEELKKQLKDIQQRINKAPSAEQAWLHDTFNTLKDKNYLRHLIEILQQEGLNDVKEEIMLVNPDNAGNCAQSISNWEGERKEKLEKEQAKLLEELSAKNELLDSARKKNDLIQALGTAKSFLEENKKILVRLDTFIETYENRESLREEIKTMDQKIDALNKLEKYIEEKETIPTDFRNTLEKSLRNVLKRFAMADGMEQATITDKFKIQVDKPDKGPQPDNDLNPGRNLKCFSTGQKAQMGMAWLVACRELLHNTANKKTIRFPHRVMIMDDPSTTFDMTNLHSQAILWRQLAYNPDPDKRFQIFIVSHHEEFSSKLLDLLCPPGIDSGGEKCSMKLIRFTDWTPKKGAVYETFDVEPAPTKLEKAWDLINEGLEQMEREL